MGQVNLSLNFFFRNLKNGELKLLSLTLLIAIFSLSATLFFTTGIHATLLDKQGMLLGGDRVLASPTPIDPSFNAKAITLQLKSATTVTFLSMLVFNQDLALADVKAVDEHYPLKGNLQVSQKLFGPEQTVYHVPEPGTVWLETNLFTLLNVDINDTIKIGNADFRVTRVLTFEPDRGGQGLTFAPRALINLKDVEKTQVLQPGSRQTYKLLVIGQENALKKWDEFVSPKLLPVQSYKVVGKEQPILDRVFTQTQDYLNMVILINIFFASIAVSQSMRRFCQRQYNTVAILRCFGAPFHRIITRFSLEILATGFIFSIIGFGFGVLFFILLKPYVETPLSIKIETLWSTPIIAAFGCVLLLLLLFGLPPILKLRSVSPLRILRKNFFKQQEIGLFRVRSLSLMKAVLNTSPKFGVAFKYGVSNLFRYSTQNIIQIFAFSLVMAGAFLLFLIHIDLIHSFNTQTLANAPNFFAINIESQDVKNFEESLNKANIQAQKLYPIIRARLLSINDTEVSMDEPNTPNSKANQNQKRIPRLLNLSYVSKLPPANEIVQGRFFTKNDWGKSVISIEQGFADRMGIQLNDILNFSIAEKTITAKVISIRKVNWDSFYPNFFVLFPPQILDNFPKTYMTSFYIENKDRSFLKPLIEQFPSINLIDISLILKQSNTLMNTVSIGIQFLLLFTGMMAVLMLYSCLYAQMNERKKDALLFRILGASKKRLSIVVLTEFALIGFCSGIIATFLAYALYLIAVNEMKIVNETSAWHWLGLGPIIGIVLIGSLAWILLRKVINITPKVLLTSRNF